LNPNDLYRLFLRRRLVDDYWHNVGVIKVPALCDVQESKSRQSQNADNKTCNTKPQTNALEKSRPGDWVLIPTSDTYYDRMMDCDLGETPENAGDSRNEKGNPCGLNQPNIVGMTSYYGTPKCYRKRKQRKRNIYDFICELVERIIANLLVRLYVFSNWCHGLVVKSPNE
jgi:hypothetical protein